MAEIILKNLVKRFGAVTAVDDVTIHVKDREFIVLVGPSGCGKTTCLRMIAGLEDPDVGVIHIDGRLVNGIPPKNRDIAMVFQNYALYPHMNVFKNMSFSLRLKKIPGTEIHRRIHEVAAILGIEELLHRKPRELSGGQRQRVAIGRAIVRNPKAFLFDEPLSNLDAKMRVQMRGELAALHERLKNTILYVTHDQVEAMTLADRIVVMHRGRIMQTGPPLQVYEKPENLFVAGFIGSPAMNILEAKIQEDSGRLMIRGDDFTFHVPEALESRYRRAAGREVFLGIRPEHLFDRAGKGAFPGGEILKTTIKTYEPQGAMVILRATCGKSRILASVDSNTRARVHDRHEFLVDTNHFHLFDKETQKAY